MLFFLYHVFLRVSSVFLFVCLPACGILHLFCISSKFSYGASILIEKVNPYFANEAVLYVHCQYSMISQNFLAPFMISFLDVHCHWSQTLNLGLFFKHFLVNCLEIVLNILFMLKKMQSFSRVCGDVNMIFFLLDWCFQLWLELVFLIEMKIVEFVVSQWIWIRLVTGIFLSQHNRFLSLFHTS